MEFGKPHKVLPGPLPPIEKVVSSNDPLQKRKLRKSRLKHKRRSKSATAIQSQWRVKLARKSIAAQKSQLSNKTTAPRSDNAEEEVLENFNKVPFENLANVNFTIDGAIGLPANCTVTRVTGRLLSQDRITVESLGIAEAYSDPQAACLAHTFDLLISWRGSSTRYTLMSMNTSIFIDVNNTTKKLHTCTY